MMQHINLLPDSMHNTATVDMCTFPVSFQIEFSAPTGYYNSLSGGAASPPPPSPMQLLYFQELRPAVEVQEAIREDTSLQAGTASENS